MSPADTDGRARPDRRISVVVPCYNRAAYLNIFLRSLTWSSVPASEFEVIVVNDGGVDHMELVADSWRRRGLNVSVLQLRAGGGPRNNAVARNAGIRAARHPIVLQTDPDIVFVSDVLQRVRDHLAPGTFCSCSGYYPLTREATYELAFGADGPADAASAYEMRACGRPNQVLSPDGVGGLHGAFACAKGDLEAIGGYDESFTHWGWEDRELLVTLQHDRGLVRRSMPDTTVVHLWHALLRGDTSRESLASSGQWSQSAWEIQMQRASADYPRSIRPRRSPVALEHSRSLEFSPETYEDWCDTREASLAGLPLTYQLFFDAHRLEAAQLRASGFSSVARAMVQYTLRRPWEQRQQRQQPPQNLHGQPGHQTRFERQDYERLDLLYEELAACNEQLWDVQAREATLLVLSRCPNGERAAAAARARTAFRHDDLAGALREAEHLRGSRWTPAMAALGIEIALLAQQPERAIAVMSADGHVESADYFERLRLFAYRQLLDRLLPAEATDAATTAVATSLNSLEGERSEFLYSSAMRSIRDGLDVAGCLLLDRFLGSGSPADARLYEEGRAHLDAARARIARRTESDWGRRIVAGDDRQG